MISDANPYETPDECRADLPVAARFESWSNLRLVGLFFIPSIVLITSFIMVVVMKAAVIITTGLGLTVLLAGAVSLLSSHIHSDRQNAGKRTLSLFLVVYLFAQIFAIFLCLAAFQIILRVFL